MSPLKVFITRIKSVFTRDETPYRLAMGFAMGTAVALTPTVGIQMAVSAVLAFLLRCNKTSAILMAWISNPITMIPIYWFDYKIGCLLYDLVGIAHVPFSKERFVAVFDGIAGSSWWEAMIDLARASMEIFAPMMVGGAVFGLAVAVPVFLLVHRYATRNLAGSGGHGAEAVMERID